MAVAVNQKRPDPVGIDLMKCLHSFFASDKTGMFLVVRRWYTIVGVIPDWPDHDVEDMRLVILDPLRILILILYAGFCTVRPSPALAQSGFKTGPVTI